MSYGLSEYAQSLAEFGSPLWLPYSQGHVLLRPIPGAGAVDATGCYPLFACAEPGGLVEDLATLRASGAVSLTLVTDPLGKFTGSDLETTFSALARPYKAHYLVDLTGDPAQLGTAHHRRNARRCARQATFATCEHPGAHLDTWTRLYDHLIDRHQITGTARFSRRAFAQQLELPGAMLVQAVDAQAKVLGMQLWFTDAKRAWHHLSAYSPAGYRQGGVSYGLMAHALVELKARGVMVADLGAGAGLQDAAADGLSRFKKGWSTHTRNAWLCGAVLDPDRYAELAGGQRTAYFPAYRDPVREPATAQEEHHVPVD